MTMTTTIDVFQKAAELGLKLGFEPPDTLTLHPVEHCPAEFGQVLKAHKPALLRLLKLPFVMADSKTLEETIFFCQDDDTRDALVRAGADPFAIYTKAELRVLVEQNRIAPFTPAELRKVHEIKRTVSGRITS
jgi:hypothetical protein